MIEFDIQSPSGWFMAERISKELTDEFGNTEEEIQLLPRQSEKQFRMVETVLLVALVSAGGTALAAFVTGLLRIMQKGAAQRLVVQKGELRVEIPVNAKSADLAKAVETLRQLEGQKADLRIE